MYFTAKYGVVGLTVADKNFIAEGVNEAGLSCGLICWIVLMTVTIAFVLWYASKIRKVPQDVSKVEVCESSDVRNESSAPAWICLSLIMVSLILFCIFHASSCLIKIGQSEFHAPWLLWTASALFALSSVLSLRNSVPKN